MRIESGQVKLNLQWQPFEEVVGAALESSRSMLQRHKVEVHIPRDLPLVRFDALLIERVLVNLLENAAKYTPPGSTVTLAAETIEDRLSVSVSDNGPGLPTGREEAVFQKFTRGDRESATPGVGLGLAICRAIVEAHQGTIVGANRPAGGAILTFTLPLGDPLCIIRVDGSATTPVGTAWTARYSPRRGSAGNVGDPLDQPEQALAVAGKR